MKAIPTIAAVLFATAATASDDNAPHRYHQRGVTVIARQSTKSIQVTAGDIPLDNLHTFECNSPAGCFIVASAFVVEPGTSNTSVCAYVDNVAAAPSMPAEDAPTLTIRQQAKVPQGSHTIQTIFRSKDAVGEIIGWETDYTIYEWQGAN